ncbi:glycoside hydrolase family 47 protein [Xylona heveae TC161]|uniref:alpha-1,2-Mannosidase n=1 Tax=Xylona heveae (strain CBS 132557 / TC161) TaxID=1328760 RepID=A0A165G433_XYLHT|nr:glycoside hydrolase family 47 protein [Xylona heveae TC161]KZF21714.1 glycoside hydrolase family 47 protein [Xylona heveae TC161]
MFYVRRLWLAPAALISLVIFFVFRNADNTARRLMNEGGATSSIRVTIAHGEDYPVSEFLKLPSEAPSQLPQIQYNFGGDSESKQNGKNLDRRRVVRNTFDRGWHGYKKYAWKSDEVGPITGEYRNPFGGWAATLVDALDTLWIMDRHEEFEEAVHVVSGINFTTTTQPTLNVFETTIRYIGGMLGAYDVSDGQYPVLLDKAKELGDFLYRAFDTPNRMPISRWDWQSYAWGTKQVAPSAMLIAEIGSLTLEFTRLSQLTGDPKYFDAVQRISNELEKSQDKTQLPGLWPVIVNAENLTFNLPGIYTIGGMVDSLYEYFPKEHMLLGGVTNQYRKLYENAVDAMKKYLFFKPMTPTGADILFSGDVWYNKKGTLNIDPRGQHLSCFAGGMVAVGAQLFDRPQDLPTARKLVEGCTWAYHSQPSGLMPEVFHMVHCEADDPCEWDIEKWHNEVLKSQKYSGDITREGVNRLTVAERLSPGFTKIEDRTYKLRPEAIESVFILYRITGDKSLQEIAWRMFTAIEDATKTHFANAGIHDVTRADSPKMDRMESFWFAETLKYFYLIFSEPNLISLDDYVLNTEAHPFKRPKANHV